MKKLKIFALGLISAVFAFGVPALAQSRGNALADEPGAVSVSVRCAFWERPKTYPPTFYIQTAKGYKMLPVFAMAFGAPVEYRGQTPISVCRKATEEEIAQRKANGEKKKDLEYIPLFTINPRGMRDIGVLLLPGKTENKPENEVLVFEWSEKSFPYGTIRIANFSGVPLIGQLTPRGGEVEQFRLKQGGIFRSKPVGTERRVFDIQLAAFVSKKATLVCSTNAVFRDNSRVMLFVIPKSKPAPGVVPEVDFRMIKEYRRDAPEAASDAGAGTPPNRRGKPDSAEKPPREQERTRPKNPAR